MDMNLAIIAQFQDMASRGMRRLMRLQQQHAHMQKAYGNATARTARQQARLARQHHQTANAMGKESHAAARLSLPMAFAVWWC